MSLVKLPKKRCSVFLTQLTSYGFLLLSFLQHAGAERDGGSGGAFLALNGQKEREKLKRVRSLDSGIGLVYDYNIRQFIDLVLTLIDIGL